MSHIFISYSRRDLAFAQKIVDALAANNLDTWIDWKSIPKGEDWWQHIRSGIEEADTFLFLISPASVNSKVCRAEIDHAVENGKRILPICIRDSDAQSVHSEISKRNWVFCRDGQDDFSKAIEDTHKTIHTDYEWLKYHTKLQIKALEWERRKDSSRLLRGKELREAEQQLTRINNQVDPQPTAIQRQYVLASQQHELRQRRQITLGLSIGFVVMLILCVAAVTASIFAVGQRNEAVSQKSIALTNEAEAIRQSEIASAGNLSSLALVHNNDAVDLSFLLGIEAINKSNTRQARDGLLTVLQSNSHLSRFLWNSNGSTVVLAYNPAGTLLASGGCGKNTEDGLLCAQGIITLWDTASGQQMGQPLVGHSKSVAALGFSPDGQTLASGSADGTILLWDLATGHSSELRFELPFGNLSALAFSPDGKTVALANDSGSFILWDMNSRQPIGEPIHADVLFDPINILLFSPDGKAIAAGNYDDTITVWDVSSQQLLVGVEDQPFESPVGSLAFSPDGQLLAAGGCGKVIPDARACVEGKIVLWSIPERRQIREPLLGHTGSVFSLAFGANNILASGSYDGTIRLWDAVTGAPIAGPLRGDNGSVSEMAFNSAGSTFASSSGHSIVLWNMNDQNYMGRPLVPDTEQLITTVAMDTQRRIIAYGSYDGAITLWNIAGNVPVAHIKPGDSGTITRLAFSPDGKLLVSSSCIKLTGENSECKGRINLWEAATGNPVDKRFNGLDTRVSALTFSPDGKILASADVEGMIGLWDISSGLLVNSLVNEWGVAIIDVKFDPDGKTLRSLDATNTVTFWDIAKKQTIGQPMKFVDSVDNLVLDPSGTLLASANANDTVSLWSAETYELLGPPLGQPAIDPYYATSGVVFSMDGEMLASSRCIEKDETGFLCTKMSIALWDVSSGQRIGLPFLWDTSGVSDMVFNPEGTQLITNGYSGFMVWDIDPYSWMQKACEIVRRNFNHAEWKQYFPNEPYHLTCPQWPAGE